MRTPVKMLFLEDDAVDRRAFLRMVREKGLPYEITSVETLAEARARLAETRFDVIVSDYHLPDGHCTELFDEVPDTPFILLTGTLQEHLALRTLERGADDYLPKDREQRHLEAVPFTVEKTLHRKSIHEKEQRLTRELQESERSLRLQTELIAQSHDAVIVRRIGGEIVSWNRGAEQLYGWKAEEVLGRRTHELLDARVPDSAAGGAEVDQVLAREGKWEGELCHRRRDGAMLTVDSRQVISHVPNDSAQFILETNRDITERKRTEEVRAWLASFPEQNPNPIVEVDLTGQVHYVNPAARQLFPDLNQQGFRHPWLMDLESLIAQLRAGQASPVSRELAVRAGTFLQVLHYIPEVHHVRVYGLDITARKAAEAQARLQAAALDAAPNAISLSKTDRQGTIAWVNPAFTRLTGYLPEEAIGRSHHILNSGRQDEAFYRHLWETIGRGEVWRGELINRRKDGSLYHEEMGITPLRDESGKITHYVAVKQDITERKRAEEALRESEQRYRSLFNAIDEGFCVIELLFDENGSPNNWRYLEVNPAFERHSGLSQALGKTMREMVPNLETLWYKIYGDVAITGKPIRSVAYSQALNHWFDLYAFRVGEPEERKVAVLFTNITERKQAEEALQRSQVLYRAMAQSIPGGAMSVVDRNLRYLIVEGELLSRLRLTREAMLGHTVLEVFEAETGLLRAEHFRRALAGEVTSYETEYQGRVVWSQFVPLRDQDGQTSTAMSLALDVTERRQAEAALRAAKEELSRTNADLERRVDERTAELREAMAEMEQMSYSMVHDMRAPLRAIQSFGGIVAEDPENRLTEESRQMIDKMRTATDRMDHLVRDVLSYSRVVREELPLGPVDVGALARGIVETYPDLLSSRAEVRVAPDLPQVVGNPAALTQCLAQLLDNAVKFAKPGQTPKIQIQKDDCGNGRVRIVVEDSGVGIVPELRDKVFGMFQQLRNTGEGTGMGLTIVKKSVERMGGRVGVESEPGRGSRFWIELKAAAQPLHEDTASFSKRGSGESLERQSKVEAES
ncbi:MAG TPA: PAS domain S-box protein [Clostridia bacterium]|nr:PAS domain S-box protein [Clostridia bacterium]